MVQVCLCLYHLSVATDGFAESGACQFFINVARQQSWSHESIYPSANQSNCQLVGLLLQIYECRYTTSVVGFVYSMIVKSQHNRTIGKFRLDGASGGL